MTDDEMKKKIEEYDARSARMNARYAEVDARFDLLDKKIDDLSREMLSRQERILALLQTEK